MALCQFCLRKMNIIGQHLQSILKNENKIVFYVMYEIVFSKTKVILLIYIIYANTKLQHFTTKS